LIGPCQQLLLCRRFHPVNLVGNYRAAAAEAVDEYSAFSLGAADCQCRELMPATIWAGTRGA
jgi:hypothetical protein